MVKKKLLRRNPTKLLSLSKRMRLEVSYNDRCHQFGEDNFIVLGGFLDHKSSFSFQYTPPLTTHLPTMLSIILLSPLTPASPPIWTLFGLVQTPPLTARLVHPSWLRYKFYEFALHHAFYFYTLLLEQQSWYIRRGCRA